MARHITIPGVALGLLLAATRSTVAGGPPAEPAVGQPLAPWLLPALDDGRPVSPADFRGRKLAVHLFASW